MIILSLIFCLSYPALDLDLALISSLCPKALGTRRATHARE